MASLDETLVTGLVEDYGGGKMKAYKAVADDEDLEAKREAKIREKEEERARKERERVAARRGSVAGGARRGSVAGEGGRRERRASVSKAELDEKRAAEVREAKEARQDKIKETEKARAKRQSIIDANEKERPRAKYARNEIMILFELFSEYDTDGGGFISVAELKSHFTKLAESTTHYDGQKKSFAERRAARAHIDMAALVEPMFEAIDVDSDGTVTFFELLKVIYPKANEEDFKTFKDWVYPPKPYVAPIQYVLSKEQKQEIKDLFKIIDTDHSGELTIMELKKMLVGSSVTGETGIDMADLQVYFDEADYDNSAAINLGEFEKLMISTGLYVPETVAPPAAA